jgi:hypothetical protein
MDASAAASHLQGAPDPGMRSHPMPVDRSYDDGPRAERDGVPGPPFNQQVRPR